MVKSYKGEDILIEISTEEEESFSENKYYVIGFTQKRNYSELTVKFTKKLIMVSDEKIDIEEIIQKEIDMMLLREELFVKKSYVVLYKYGNIRIEK